MAKKIFTYRGKTIEELQAMSLKDFAILLPSKLRRSVLRGFKAVQKKLLEDLVKAGEGKTVRTHARDMVILPQMAGKTISVHDGKQFVRLDISAEMVGHRLGEFAITRKYPKHGTPGIGATRSSMYIPLR